MRLLRDLAIWAVGRTMFARDLGLMLHNQSHRFRRAVAQCMPGTIALGLLSFFCFRVRLNLATTVCLYLIIIVLLSLQDSFLSSAVVSFIAVGCLAYLFAPPIFSFRVSDPFEIVATVGNDLDSTHSAVVDYAELLPSLFEPKAGNFSIALAGERDLRYALKIICKY